MTIAHVALGELVIPRVLQSPEVIDALQRAAAENNIPLEMLRVGNAANRINPNTGQPEFSPLSIFWRDWLSGQSAERTYGPNPASPIPQANADDMDAPTFKNLGFDPNGPGEWGTALRDPVGAWRANQIKRQVTKEALNLFDRDLESLVGGPGDAWRHGRIVQQVAHELGPIRAKAFADAHERSNWNENNPGENLQDLYNNQVALGLPSDPKGHMNPETVLQNALRGGYLRRKPF